MKIKKIRIKNFRLLENIDKFEFDLNHTIVVGRNNSGKTSLTELFKKFFDDSNSFQFEDFSLNTHNNFNKSFELYKNFIEEDEGNTEEKNNKFNLFEKSIPKIELEITFKGIPPFGFPQELEENEEYKIKLEYTFKNILDFFKKIDLEKENFIFINYLKKNFNGEFEIRKFYIDSTGGSERVKKDIQEICKVDFIDAQRNLDDNSNDKNKTLSKIFETYYKSNNKGKEENINHTLEKVNSDLDIEYDIFFKKLNTDLQSFGYPGLGDKERKLKLKSELESEKLLEGNNSKIYYSQETHDLPESYNGLGYSNLIYIILQFIHLYGEFNKLNQSQFQLLFIEEPEAHLHPQMQQTFIKQIQSFIEGKGWNIQIIITTHSSHIVSSSEFNKIRYFIKKESGTEIKNLGDFEDIDENKIFLYKYLTLEKSDMFFADKLIMIEGMVERILLPLFIKKIDNEIGDIKEKLSSQYISTIEVGGAYAHKFEKFLKFLGIKSLIITDIDSIGIDGKKCKVSEGIKTSNYTLIKWLPKKEELNDLISISSDNKEKDNFRIAYQTEENGNIGRSFEDAFILANSDILEKYEDKKNEELKVINKSIILEKKFKSLSKKVIEETGYYEISKYIDDNSKKTDFAFDIMMLDDFNVPKYIKEGLIWLSK